jgi:hypothetical protein
MTYDETRTDRHPTDEPDGTSAYAASLRPPGESVARPAPDSDTADADADFFAGDAGVDSGDVLDDDLADEFGTDVGDGFSSDDVDPTSDAARRRPRSADSRAGYDVDAVSGDTDAVRPR